MKQRFDIRIYKRSLRKHYKNLRDKIQGDEKAEKDNKVLETLVALPEYINCDTVLIYVSINSEIDTYEIIRRIWADGKKTAVPRCKNGTREMDFYYISSFSELEIGTFSVMEPKSHCKKARHFGGSICVLPGYSFDEYGYRLGYGGGYYDRFLSKKYQMTGGEKIGICYDLGLRTHLARGKYDIACDKIITESTMLVAKKLRKRSKPLASKGF